MADTVADRGGDVLGLAEQAAHAGDVEERLVDRQLLDERGDRIEDRHDFAALVAVAAHARRQEYCMRAGGAGPRHRHRRVDAEPARLVARRADHSPSTETADDHGPAAQPRVVELFDRGEERVEVDVQDRRVGPHVRASRQTMDVRSTRMSSRVVPNTS